MQPTQRYPKSQARSGSDIVQLSQPLLFTGSTSSTVFGFAVAACNERNDCAWTDSRAIIYDEVQPIGGPAICE